MNNSDKQRFKDAFEELDAYYRSKNPMTNMGLRLYWATLCEYSIEQVLSAITSHVGDPSCGEFFPKASDIVRQMQGGKITQDMVISAAKLAKTPFGILCAIHLGSHDLANADAFQLRQQAQECLDLLPEWRAREAAGEYSDHELEVMAKRKVNPMQPFMVGLPSPQANQNLEARYYITMNRQAAEADDLLRLEAPAQSKAEGISRVQSIVATLTQSATPDYRSELLACSCCGTMFEEILNICPAPSCGIKRNEEEVMR